MMKLPVLSNRNGRLTSHLKQQTLFTQILFHLSLRWQVRNFLHHSHRSTINNKFLTWETILKKCRERSISISNMEIMILATILWIVLKSQSNNRIIWTQHINNEFKNKIICFNSKYNLPYFMITKLITSKKCKRTYYFMQIVI